MTLDPGNVSVVTEEANVRACPWNPNPDLTCPYPDEAPINSLYGLFTHSAAKFPNSPCLGWRPGPDLGYLWWSYAEVNEKILAIRCALAAKGLKKGDRVAVYAKNCPQWILVQYAILAGGMVIVPIYDTLGPNIVEYVCNHAGISLVFVSAANFPEFAKVYNAGKAPSVEHVIVISGKDIVPDPAIDACLSTGIVSISDFLDSGKQAIETGKYPLPDLQLDDLLVIMYTSGTTGLPKGVKLSHRALIASVSSAYFFFKKWNQEFFSTDIFLSYLPLSHIFEQQAEALVLGVGGRIGFFSGDIKLLLSDIEALKPTLFAGVPRVFARFQQRIEENVQNASIIAKTLFGWGYARQVRAEENPSEVARSGIWDALVFKKVRAKLLPNCRLVITGSAPMSKQTNDFLKVCLICPVVQGYGLTETVGGMLCSVPGLSKSGTCGGPLPGVEVKLRDLPEMGYLNSDKPYPRGEVCVKGDIVFSGYYDNENATSAAFDEDGFFLTGDVGQWREDGSLQIIDRAKNLFKLSQGEYVSPENLEQEYSKAKLVGQIFVYGNSLQATLLAVVVPDVPAATAWGETHGVGTLESIAKHAEFKKELLAQLAEMRAISNFKKYETIRDVVIEATGLNNLGQGFTIENDLMTPSFKLKRPQLKAKYSDRLEELYEKM